MALPSCNDKRFANLLVYKYTCSVTTARFPLGEFVRATRSENKNSAT